MLTYEECVLEVCGLDSNSTTIHGPGRNDHVLRFLCLDCTELSLVSSKMLASTLTRE